MEQLVAIHFPGMRNVIVEHRRANWEATLAIVRELCKRAETKCDVFFKLRRSSALPTLAKRSITPPKKFGVPGK
jgi:hypothetical protein